MSAFEVTVQQLNELLSDGEGFTWPCHDQDEVVSGVFVGNARAAMNVRRLRRLGITHVLNAAEGRSLMHVDTGAQFYAGVDVAYRGLPASDTDHFNLSVFFEEAADFIHNALQARGGTGRVLVHCKEGYSRSPTLVIAYLMLHLHMDVHTAVATIRRGRAIGPNDSFLHQLCCLQRCLEEDRRATWQWPPPPPPV